MNGFQIPPRPLSPPDTAEEHYERRCEFCGFQIHEDWGCKCNEFDVTIDDARWED